MPFKIQFLFKEPVYNDGAESIYIMDQVKDSKILMRLGQNNDNNANNEKLNDKEKMIITKDFLMVELKWKLRKKLEFLKLKFLGLEKNAIEHIKDCINNEFFNLI